MLGNYFCHGPRCLCGVGPGLDVVVMKICRRAMVFFNHNGSEADIDGLTDSKHLRQIARNTRNGCCRARYRIFVRFNVGLLEVGYYEIVKI